MSAVNGPRPAVAQPAVPKGPGSNGLIASDPRRAVLAHRLLGSALSGETLDAGADAEAGLSHSGGWAERERTP